MKTAYVCIMANRRNGTLYTGVTSDLIGRVYQHKNDLTEGFSSRYQCHSLVYFEVHESVYEAIRREKQIKAWKRKWKLELIESNNPEWKDLYTELL